MPEANVHRELRLTSPMTEGADVKALQQALNKIASQFPKIVQFKLDEDGVLGEQTVQATHKAAHVMGLIRRALNVVEKEHRISERLQRKLRNPDIRSDAEKQRGERRRDDLRERLKAGPSLTTMAVTATAGNPHWGGAGDVMTAFIEPFMVKRGLPIGSGKRTPLENANVGGSKNSDHLTTNTTTAARDFPTFAGEDDARALAKALGIGAWQPNSFTGHSITAGGRAFRVQILWGSAIKHGDHVHVGVQGG